MKKKSQKMVSIEDLARITARGFESIETRFDSIEDRLASLEDGQKKIHNDILNIHDSFVKRSEFDNLALRVMRLEAKSKSR